MNMEILANQFERLSTELKNYKTFIGKPDAKKMMFSKLVNSFLTTYVKPKGSKVIHLHL